MKLNQWKGFIQINKSSCPLLLSGVGKSADCHFVLPGLGLLSIYHCWQVERSCVTQGWNKRGLRLLFNPRPHLSLVLSSSQRWANGTSGQNRLIKLSNSKDNTDPNQSETPVERLWAGTQDTPWGCHQQGQVESRTVLTCQPFPYFPCATPNHHCWKHLFKKLMGVTLGGNSVNRHWQRWVLRKDYFKERGRLCHLRLAEGEGPRYFLVWLLVSHNQGLS